MKYPLGEFEKNKIISKTGKKLDDITISSILNGSIKSDDIKISKEVLNYQSEVSKSVGRHQLAENFDRGAELVNVPEKFILEVYNKLRPNRATKSELENIVNILENEYNAFLCAKLVKDAIKVYEKRNVLLD